MSTDVEVFEASLAEREQLAKICESALYVAVRALERQKERLDDPERHYGISDAALSTIGLNAARIAREAATDLSGEAPRRGGRPENIVNIVLRLGLPRERQIELVSRAVRLMPRAKIEEIRPEVVELLGEDEAERILAIDLEGGGDGTA